MTNEFKVEALDSEKFLELYSKFMVKLDSLDKTLTSSVKIELFKFWFTDKRDQENFAINILLDERFNAEQKKSEEDDDEEDEPWKS